MPSRKPKGPEFVRFFQPVLAALGELGGSGSPGEVCDLVADALGISEEQLSEQLKNGSSRFRNQVAWARFYLVKADLVDASVRGVWILTAKGRRTTLSHQEAYRLFKEVHAKWPPQKKAGKEAKELNRMARFGNLPSGVTPGDSSKDKVPEVVYVGALSFVRVGELLVDSRFTEAMRSKLIRIETFGDEYFAILKGGDELKKILALGEKIIFLFNE